MIDHTQVYVSINAYNILSELRQNEIAILVWIDCLCINQEDKEEKPSQLHHMFDIYQSAMKTFIYLGKSDASSDTAMTYAAGEDLYQYMPELLNEIQY